MRTFRGLWLLKFDVHFSSQMSTRCPSGHESEIALGSRASGNVCYRAALAPCATKYTYVHEDLRESLDHVPVSEQFYDNSRNRRWSFDGLVTNNDHLNVDNHK